MKNTNYILKEWLKDDWTFYSTLTYNRKTSLESSRSFMEDFSKYPHILKVLWFCERCIEGRLHVHIVIKVDKYEKSKKRLPEILEKKGDVHFIDYNNDEPKYKDKPNNIIPYISKSYDFDPIDWDIHLNQENK